MIILFFAYGSQGLEIKLGKRLMNLLKQGSWKSLKRYVLEKVNALHMILGHIQCFFFIYVPKKSPLETYPKLDIHTKLSVLIKLRVHTKLYLQTKLNHTKLEIYTKLGILIKLHVDTKLDPHPKLDVLTKLGILRKPDNHTIIDIYVQNLTSIQN